ncbi:synaptosomal-associated protein 29 [Octopus bimaculoides]|uniref:t-SNARE coiled-coil homology domain-containing protein n=1 Tax=Octopus bimaculoides TaxID=37653 RepID=A0A0L8FZY1_OCTBM|nr:synaptosomal-associated protein 29 [Octopus bimaculoides]|eukprot:XP_014785631.1 PREDICTED: synaptosomal-associated protein 29-like [Octopus bimaculoides]
MMANKSNPFFDDDELDAEFLKGSRHPNRNQFGYDNDESPHQLLSKVEESEIRQLESTRNALASIYDSEQMGIATAEELLHQGEQLDNIERKTDSMSVTLTASQKHINNIKSVFGGIKNWWNRGSDKKLSETDSPPSRNSQLKEAVNSAEKIPRPVGGTHRKQELNDMYTDGPVDLDRKFLAGSRMADSQMPDQSRHITNSQHETKMNENLDLMSTGLSRLKGLASELGNEIEEQNLQLDRINTKVEGVDSLIQGQEKQLRRILRK